MHSLKSQVTVCRNNILLLYDWIKGHWPTYHIQGLWRATGRSLWEEFMTSDLKPIFRLWLLNISWNRFSWNKFSWKGFSQINCILTWTMYPFWTKYIPLAFTVTLKQTPASGKHVKPTLGRIQTRHFTIFSPTLNCIDVFTGIPRSTVNYVWTPTTKL